MAMLERFRGTGGTLDVEPVTSPAEILAAQSAIDHVRVDGIVARYLLEIVASTRQHDKIQLGAQAQAAMDGHDYVLPDDVKALAGPTLGHRIVVEIGAELRGEDSDDIIGDILDTVAVPIEPGP